MEGRQRTTKCPLRDERGAETVELAVTFLLLAMVLFSGFELGWAMTQKKHLQQAALVGAREAALRGSTAASVTARVQDSLLAEGITTATVTLVPAEPSVAMPGTTVEVTVTVDYSTVQLLGLSALMALPDQITSKATMVKEPLR